MSLFFKSIIMPNNLYSASYKQLKTGKEFFSFGKYKHKSVDFVLKTNPDYIKWIKLNTKRMFSPWFEGELKRLNII